MNIFALLKSLFISSTVRESYDTISLDKTNTDMCWNFNPRCSTCGCDSRHKCKKCRENKCYKCEGK